MQRLLPFALALVLLGGAQLAHADDAAPAGATITIAPSDGGAPRALALADLTGSFDVHGVTYTVRAADGTESAETVADGISLRALLTAAGLDADAFDYILLPKPDGSSAIVMRDDLGGAGEGPPVMWADAQGIHFLRPSSGDGDANGVDRVTLTGGSIAIALRKGQPVVPRIAVSKLRARPGERIDFGASLVGDAPLGPGLGYQWYFDGTGRVRGANVSHRFTDPGVYQVLLNVVRGDGSSVGVPATQNVRVVRQRQRPSRDARRSDESQQDAGGTVGAGSGSAGTGGGGTGTSEGAGSPASAPVPHAPPVAVPGATAPPSTSAPTRRQAPAPRRTSPGELVSGTLLASASAAAAPVDAAPAAAAAARGATADGPLNVPVGVWIAAGLAALLALGWALESRHTLPFWQP